MCVCVCKAFFMLYLMFFCIIASDLSMASNYSTEVKSMASNYSVEVSFYWLKRQLVEDIICMLYFFL